MARLVAARPRVGALRNASAGQFAGEGDQPLQAAASTALLHYGARLSRRSRRPGSACRRRRRAWCGRRMAGEAGRGMSAAILPPWPRRLRRRRDPLRREGTIRTSRHRQEFLARASGEDRLRRRRAQLPSSSPSLTAAIAAPTAGPLALLPGTYREVVRGGSSPRGPMSWPIHQFVDDCTAATASSAPAAWRTASPSDAVPPVPVGGPPVHVPDLARYHPELSAAEPKQGVVAVSCRADDDDAFVGASSSSVGAGVRVVRELRRGDSQRLTLVHRSGAQGAGPAPGWRREPLRPGRPVIELVLAGEFLDDCAGRFLHGPRGQPQAGTQPFGPAAGLDSNVSGADTVLASRLAASR